MLVAIYRTCDDPAGNWTSGKHPSSDLSPSHTTLISSTEVSTSHPEVLEERRAPRSRDANATLCAAPILPLFIGPHDDSTPTSRYKDMYAAQCSRTSTLEAVLASQKASEAGLKLGDVNQPARVISFQFDHHGTATEHQRSGRGGSQLQSNSYIQRESSAITCHKEGTFQAQNQETQVVTQSVEHKL